MELYGMLKIAESNMAKIKTATSVLAIKEGRIKKTKPNYLKGKRKKEGWQTQLQPQPESQGKGKTSDTQTPEDAICFPLRRENDNGGIIVQST